jgi:hypothetical protein
MDMRDSLDTWLKKYPTDFDPSEADRLCTEVLGLEGNDIDGCVSLVAALEKESIDRDKFTDGLCDLTGKTPEELHAIIKSREETDEQRQEETSGETTEPGSTGDIIVLEDVRSGERAENGGVEPTRA